MADIDWRPPAVSLFNEAWTYIDKDGRSADDDRAMLATALGSLACWRKAGNAENFSISDWQVSRVYALLGDAVAAKHYGESALQQATDGKLGPFYAGFAHEALARAALVAGDHSLSRRHIASATVFAGKVESARDRGMLDAALDDLESKLPGAPTRALP